MTDTREWRTGSRDAMTLRVNSGSQATSYALAPARARVPARDDARPQQPVVTPPQNTVARISAKPDNIRFADAKPSPGYSSRGQRALNAYTQLQVIEQRAQYSQLLGVDIYA